MIGQKFQIFQVSTTIDRLTTLWKYDISERLKTRILSRSGRNSTTVWLHFLEVNEMFEENVDGNIIRMLPSVLNRSWKAAAYKTAAL